VKLVVAVVGAAALIGIIAGGGRTSLSRMRLRWPALAVGGLGLQLVPAPGRGMPLALLLGSFALLTAFAFANLRTPGFSLILIGTLLNATVIAVNGGMPVSGHALRASGQSDALRGLSVEAEAKHHLATADDRLLPLADVIPVPPPVGQAISLGDALTYAGAAWVVAAGARRHHHRRRRTPASSDPPITAHP
jgi:Family of unknown function (DUF5317)